MMTDHHPKIRTPQDCITTADNPTMDTGAEAAPAEPATPATAVTRTRTRKPTLKDSATSDPAPSGPAPNSPGSSPAVVSAGSKLDRMLALLAEPGGATLAALSAATGWQTHSVRGALAGALRKRGHAVISEKTDGVRRYRLGDPA